MLKRTIFIPTAFATRAWPSSWTMIRNAKARTAAAIERAVIRRSLGLLLAELVGFEDLHHESGSRAAMAGRPASGSVLQERGPSHRCSTATFGRSTPRFQPSDGQPVDPTTIFDRSSSR